MWALQSFILFDDRDQSIWHVEVQAQRDHFTLDVTLIGNVAEDPHDELSEQYDEEVDLDCDLRERRMSDVGRITLANMFVTRYSVIT